jgi:hypothetical protein
LSHVEMEDVRHHVEKEESEMPPRLRISSASRS